MQRDTGYYVTVLSALPLLATYFCYILRYFSRIYTSYVPESEDEDESSDNELELSDSELWQDDDPDEDGGRKFRVTLW